MLTLDQAFTELAKLTASGKATTQQLMDIKTLELSKVGFSKYKEGDTIHFVFKKIAGAKENRYTALKVVIIPQEYFQK